MSSTSRISPSTERSVTSEAQEVLGQILSNQKEVVSELAAKTKDKRSVPEPAVDSPPPDGDLQPLNDALEMLSGHRFETHDELNSAVGQVQKLVKKAKATLVLVDSCGDVQAGSEVELRVLPASPEQTSPELLVIANKNPITVGTSSSMVLLRALKVAKDRKKKDDVSRKATKTRGHVERDVPDRAKPKLSTREMIDLAAESISPLTPSQAERALDEADLSKATIRRIRSWSDQQLCEPLDLSDALDESCSHVQRRALERVLTMGIIPSIAELSSLTAHLAGVKLCSFDTKRALVLRLKHLGACANAEFVLDGAPVVSMTIAKSTRTTGQFDIRTRVPGKCHSGVCPPLLGVQPQKKDG